MSITTTIFRKDIRQFRILIGMVSGLLAVLVAVRLEWTGSVMPDPAANSFVGTGLDVLLATITVILAWKLVYHVVFGDSPGRRERFLATRPVSGRQLLLAKFLFLAAFVAGPFALAAAVHLALSGMPPRVVFLGTAQSLVRSGVLIALAVPLVLPWETHRRLMAGLTAAALGVGAFSLAIGLLFERGAGALVPPFRPDVFADPLVQVKAAAIAAIVLGTLAAVHLRRPLGLPTRLAVLFLAGVIVPLLAGISSSRQAAIAAEAVPRCEMVRLGFNPTYSDDKPVLGISLTPSTPTPPTEDTAWNFASLRLGEYSLPLLPRRDPRRVPSAYLPSQFSCGIEAALRRHLDPGWVMVSNHAWRNFSPTSATAFARPPRIPGGPAPVEALLRGDRFSWHCVAELPFTPGSSVRDGDATWTFGRVARDGLDRFTFSVRHSGPELWLDPRGRTGPLDRRGHVFAVLDREKRLITMLRDPYPVRATLGQGTACPRRGLVLGLEGFRGIHDFCAGDPDRLRLLILRPRYEGTQFARWSSPAVVELPTPRRASNDGFANDPSDLKPADIARWIDDNPPPPATQPDATIVPYLVALLEQTNRCSNLRKEHPAVATLAAYVPGHLDLLLRALDALHMDQYVSERLLLDAIETGLDHRQLPEVVRRIPDHPRLLMSVVNRGWTADIAPDLARLIRNGNHHDQILQAVAWLPDIPGISHDEWLAVFRLNPSHETYQLLRRVPGLEPQLNTLVDASIVAHIPILEDHSIDPLLRLALVRGHPDAPILLQQVVRYAVNLDRHGGTWFSDDITRHFDVSSCPGHRNDPDVIVPWFLAQDPADFTCDPDSHKYKLKSATP